MTVAARPNGIDPFNVRRSSEATGFLRELSDATVLDAADVHTALVLGRLAGGADEEVLVAAALAVRAVRMGHVYVDLQTIARTVSPDDEDVEVDLDALPWPDPGTWPATLAASRLTAVGADGPANRPLRLIGGHLYLDRYWRHEQTVIADLLRRSDSTPPHVDPAALRDGLGRLFEIPPGTTPGDDLQRLAAASAILRRFAVVAGGPGTGKTTTVARILALLYEQSAALGSSPPWVAMAAPTGKAAARMAEAVHAEAATLDVAPAIRSALLDATASTLHRLLGWQPGNRSRFRHHADNQLPHTVVIVDESSMVSLSMMAKLLEAVRSSARLVLVGDPRQLASVEAGAVLGDVVGPAARCLWLRSSARVALEEVVGGPVVASDPGPTAAIGDGIVVLRRVHRFHGAIADLAQAIDAGNADAAVAVLRANDDEVTWIEETTGPEPNLSPSLTGIQDAVVAAASAVVDAARNRDSATALKELRAVQVLCVHRRGPFGASRWRVEIERWLRAAIPGYGGATWFAGRPLLVTENDYGLNVFNGDTGVVVDTGGGRLRAVFERRDDLLEVRPTRLASVESLYAMTVHKAQGSQFGAVIVVLPDASSPILTRELLYTAVTRAQAKVTLVASEEAVRAAVGRPIARASGLADALWPGVESIGPE
jgi:exodeoxyribonuclease V alpha subunit